LRETAQQFVDGFVIDDFAFELACRIYRFGLSNLVSVNSGWRVSPIPVVHGEVGSI
jgi:hypothetical protein